MAKRGKILIITLCALLLVFSVAGCNKTGEKTDGTNFVGGPDGLVMSFVPNYPPGKIILTSTNEPISIIVEVKNKGTYPPQGDKFSNGAIHLSGFDTSIISITSSKSIPEMDLPAVSNINPGGTDIAQFDGNINSNSIVVDNYNPTILVTACYPYVTKAVSTVCIDPEPFDTKREKVCSTGNQNLPNQGAPIAVTRIEQESARGKIYFKIAIKNVGRGDVLWGTADGVAVVNRCNPNQGTKLERKEFDRVKLKKVKMGDSDRTTNCAPFIDGTPNRIGLFNGEGFVICSYDVPSTVQSAYTTPIDIELEYVYRSTISMPIQIKSLG